jgi:hypothetical protein
MAEKERSIPMKLPPSQTREGGPREEAAPNSKSDGQRQAQGHAKDKREIPLLYSDQFRQRAEEAARQLIRSWCDYGPKQVNQCDPDTLPGIHAKIGHGVLDAMLNHGAKDYAGVRAYFTGAPDGLLAELGECNQGNSPHPKDCGPLLAIIAEHHLAFRRDMLAAKLSTSMERRDDPAPVLAELAALEAEAASGNQTLRERAYSLRFNPDDAPPPDELCMMLGDYPIAARGNLSVIQGKSKVGKSAVVSAVLGAAQRATYLTGGDTLCISWEGEPSGAIIHLDTEQSRADWHGLVSRSVTRSGLAGVSPRLISLPLVLFARSERLEILRQSLAFEREQNGRVDLVVIDGIADLCKSPNDEAEALELVSQVHALAQDFNTAIFCILHENPGTQEAKTRGHLGSELNRKAFANLRIDKDTETSVSTIYGTDMRKRDIPREQGFCIAWDDAVHMHTFQGRAAGLKAAQREAEAVAKARTEWEPIFEFAAEQRENPAFPALTPKEAAEIEKKISGKENLTKPDTMKKRMQKAESLGVLRKSDPLRWALIPAGTAGKPRENGNHSRP